MKIIEILIKKLIKFSMLIKVILKIKKIIMKLNDEADFVMSFNVN